MKREYLIVQDTASERLLEELNQRDDIAARRVKRLLALPDLTRKEYSPLKFIVDKILAMEMFKNFDVIEIPEIVSVRDNFDLLNAPLDHPSRKETDTYYVSKDYILRTQTTVMWPFYLQKEEEKKKLDQEGEIGLLSYGKVFRKDEIDRNHFPVFHQIDGLYICKKTKKIIGMTELQNVLTAITKAMYGETIQFRFLEDMFPFTDPSTQIEIQRGDTWLEIVGAGVVHTHVLSNLGIDPAVYNGWAFGFGLERIAMAKMNIPDIRIFWSEDQRITSQFKNIESQYKEISKFPMTYRDISFVVDAKTALNNYYEIVRDCAENLVEHVELSDTYRDEQKFGADKVSYTFRIVYRSPERTLTNEEVNRIQDNIIQKTKEELGATIR